MHGHWYNIMWSHSKNTIPGADAIQYRNIVIRNGEKVVDEIKTLYTLSTKMALDLLQSWNTSRPGNQWNPDDLVYIYYPI